LELLRPLRRSAGDLVPYYHSSSSWGSITTWHFVYHIRLCYSHKLCYIIIWPLICYSVSVYIYIRLIWLQAVFKRSQRITWRRQLSELRDALGGHCGEKICFSLPPPFNLAGGSRRVAYSDAGITETDWATRGGGVGRYRVVYRLHLSIRNTHSLSFPALGPLHSCRDFIDPRNFCGSSQLGTTSYRLTLSSNTPTRTTVSQEITSDANRALPFHRTIVVWTLSCPWRLWSSESGDALGGHARVNSEMQLDAVSDRIWRCTWRPRSSELRDAIGCHDQAWLDTRLEAEIKWTERCHWKPRSNGLRDATGGRDRVSLEMHFEAERGWTQRCTSRPYSSAFRDALGVHNQSRLETCWHAVDPEAVNLEAVDLDAVDLEAVDWEGGVMGGETWFIVYPIIVGPRRIEYNQVPQQMKDETGWEWETVDLGMMQYSVYAVVSVNSWSWHEEIARDDLTLCSEVMVELRTRKREMRADGGNHHQAVGLREYRVRVNLRSQIWQAWAPIWRLMTLIQGIPNPMRQVAPLISHIRFNPPYRSRLHPPYLFLILNSIIIAEDKVKSFLSIFPCHDHELTLCTAYTKYSIHRQMEHTLYIEYTEYSIHPRLSVFPVFWQWQVDHECSCSFRRASSQDGLPPASSPSELKDKVTPSHSHHWEFLSQTDTIEWQHLARLPLTACKYSSHIARSWPPSASPYLLKLDHKVYLHPGSITASKCISELTQSRPRNTSTYLLDYGLQLHLSAHLILASKCISKLSSSWHPIASLSSLNHAHQVDLQTHMITASNCISEFTWSWPPSASPHSVDHSIQLHLCVRSILASKCISNLTWSWHPILSLSSLDCGLQMHLQIRSITASNCISQSTRSMPPCASPNSLDHGLQLHLWVHMIVIFRRTSKCPHATSSHFRYSTWRFGS